jgi:hypothetical protein
MFEDTPQRATDYERFRASRQRLLDRLAADALLTRIERAADAEPRDDPGVRMERLEVEGELTVLLRERRLVLDYFSPRQRDLADVVRDLLAFAEDGFGARRIGRVRIVVERIPEGPR